MAGGAVSTNGSSVPGTECNRSSAPSPTSPGADGGESTSPDPTYDAIRLSSSYQVLAARRVYHDSLFWQTPLLTLAALAFLYFIALSSGTSPDARVIAAGLAIVVTVTSWQLFERHRYHEHIDAGLLKRFEKEQRLPEWHRVEDNERIALLTRPAALFEPRLLYVDPSQIDIPKSSWLARRSTFLVWRTCLWVFLGASMLIIVLAVLWPSTLA